LRGERLTKSSSDCNRDVEEEVQPLRERLSAAASDSIGALSTARPELPAELDDRAADCWEPLLAIADLVGGDWPERARRAARLLSTKEREDDSLGVKLLSDIRDLFDKRGCGRIARTELVAALVAFEERPWGDLRGKPLNGRKLGQLLRPYRIRSRTVRLSNEKTVNGFKREQFEDSWRRYLPAEASHQSHPADDRTTPPNSGRAENGQVMNPAEHATSLSIGDVIDVIGTDDADLDQPGYADEELARISRKFGSGAFTLENGKRP
jgi:hypothetical protein